MYHELYCSDETPGQQLCQIKNVLSGEQSLKLVIQAKSFRKHKCSKLVFLI